MAVVAESKKAFVLLAEYDRSKAGKFFSPSFVYLHADALIVTDEINHCLYQFDTDLNFIKKTGSQGKGEGQFWYPTALAADPNGYLYVADRWNHRIQVFDTDLKFQGFFGRYGSDPGAFNEPMGICYHRGTLYVSERSNGRIQAFDSNRKLVCSFQNNSPGPGFYETDLFQKNEHYRKWSKTCSRFNTVETQFYTQGFAIGAVEYPQYLVEFGEESLLAVDRINGEAVIFSNDLKFQGRLQVPGKDGGNFAVRACCAGLLKNSFWLANDNINREIGNLCYFDGNQYTGERLKNIRIWSLCVSDSRLFIADFWNGKIASFQIN